MKSVAYCWATGLIEFGIRCPAGALPIAKGEDAMLRELVSALAEHRENQLFLPRWKAKGSPSSRSSRLNDFITFRRVVEARLQRTGSRDEGEECLK